MFSRRRSAKRMLRHCGGFISPCPADGGRSNRGGFVAPQVVEQLWKDQFDWVYREMDYAVFPFTIHPDVAGRPQVLLMLERVFDYIGRHSGVEWLTFADVADDFRRRVPFGS